MAGNNYRKVKKILWIILGANLTVALTKIVIGKAINSTSLTADGYHSLADGASNIIGLIGIYLAAKPGDQDHPYGHKKYETMAGLIIGGMLFFLSINILFSAIERFRNPLLPNITIVSLIALIATLIVNIAVAFLEYRQGRKLGSSILVSDSLHTRADIYISFGVLITLALIRLGAPAVIDPIVSLAVAGFVLHAAYEVFMENCDVLLDKAVVDNEKISEIVLGFEEVIETHKIRSRGSKEEAYIDLHIMVDPQLSIDKAHELEHRIEEQIREKTSTNAKVIIHIEPFSYKKN